MKTKIINFLKEKQPIILTIVLVVLLVSNCNQRSREKEVLSLQKEHKVEIENLKGEFSNELDSLSKEFEKTAKIEGLKAEKRMIQSTDRKIWDLKRQSEIDKEIELLEK